MSSRTVFGRLRSIETKGGLFSFELHKTKYDRKTGEISEAGGLHVRKRHSRKVKLLTFEHLANGAELETEVLGMKYRFALSSEGLLAQRVGTKTKRLIPFEELVNASNKQPVLFPELLKKKE